jgi:hypothetical protein
VRECVDDAKGGAVMSKTWMIYGANGYTGRLAARVARELRQSPILADRNRAHIESMPAGADAGKRVFDLQDPGEIAKKLDGIGMYPSERLSLSELHVSRENDKLCWLHIDMALRRAS